MNPRTSPPTQEPAATAQPDAVLPEYTIRAGSYSAVVTARAAALRQLQHAGRDLIVPFPAGGAIPDFRGVIAAPWPNRIRDGRYVFNGKAHQLPINELERSNALHGLVFLQNWEPVVLSSSSAVLVCETGPFSGYPYRLRIQACYRLDAEGLHTSVTATNIGDRTAPYGVCPHPYLVAGSSPLDQWVLRIPAEAFLEVTADRLLPVRTRPVTGHEFDFREPRSIGSTKVDHAFTGLRPKLDDRATLTLRDPAGTGVGMSWDSSCPWLQVHTADKKPPLPSRIGLAVEPMTCPPDAFNSGINLIELRPGENHQAQWTIFAL